MKKKQKKLINANVITRHNIILISCEELHKPIFRNFKKRTVDSRFKDNSWRVDLADMHSLSKYKQGIKCLLCAIDVFTKYAWVIPRKNRKRC